MSMERPERGQTQGDNVMDAATTASTAASTAAAAMTADEFYFVSFDEAPSMAEDAAFWEAIAMSTEEPPNELDAIFENYSSHPEDFSMDDAVEYSEVSEGDPGM
ncbi:hypothetical protein BFP70_12275 [Thioclava sp. SK-1]|uniref:hypothetical protein n=1 Tax=Thioclava sp. SK-1 TaxID=1889770 RepID=UPI000825CE0C|nr:hypothetical protein [Thioclava sp. SK-1]OCX63420.1 hypothetical protein BFP70_12275 [Thioclava sp. SK-1]